MAEEQTGRLVSVQTKFHREAVRPGGINRSGANMSSARSMAALQAEVEAQIAGAVAPLAGMLRDWDGQQVRKGCAWAALVRDLAGLAGRDLLTEVAMHCFDCLDAVLVDGIEMRREEALCYADALVFAQQDLCRGEDLTPYAPLLADLATLTDKVLARAQDADPAAR